MVVYAKHVTLDNTIGLKMKYWDTIDENELIKLNSVADLILWPFSICGKHFTYFHLPKVTAESEQSVEEKHSHMTKLSSSELL